ncbi:hypothetical protein BI312_11415 [Xanthomonas citri pv. citri]|nr:hypothetical protein BI314_03555 [Xanthomonas citri pv. citri]APR15353.1 hypothetical protein BI315_11345 [Xanthomonas citri pv. citri]APR21902.1 hypothetical protein BI316_22725 [Xanthomonas citri pv. citri]APR25871.1 hypothetical protein BJD09_18545 [Xanthomonas citri pv. citri]OLR71757.1 hypothetical protein BI312_11415 [Xanthomonas citri pv. citri]
MNTDIGTVVVFPRSPRTGGSGGIAAGYAVPVCVRSAERTRCIVSDERSFLGPVPPSLLRPDGSEIYGLRTPTRSSALSGLPSAW